MIAPISKLTFGQLFDLNIGNLKKEDVRNQNLSHIKVSYSMFKDSFIRGYGNKIIENIAEPSFTSK